MSIQRKVGLFGALVGAIVIVTGAMAYACTNLATLNLSKATGKPGDSIIVTGSSFRMPAGVTTGAQIRWNGIDGPVLAEATPDKAGNFSTTLNVPEAQPDTYVIVATLRDAKGVDTSGTPARAQFQVLGGAGKAVPAATGGQVSAAAAAESSTSAPIALLVLLGIAGLALFAAGFAAFVRQTRKAPAAAKIHNQ